MNGFPGFSEESLDAVFELLGRLADVFVRTLGDYSEIVVHDLRTIDASVIAIAGMLTNRVVGAPIPDPEFVPERLRSISEDQVLYTTRTLDGRCLYSSTVWVRDLSGVIRGAICINVDQSDFRRAHEMLATLVAGLPATDTHRHQESVSPLTTFARSVDDFAMAALNQEMLEIGKPIHKWTRSDRLQVIGSLETQGVFQLRRSVEAVAEQIGVSRATVFSYLREIRRDAAAYVEASE